MNGWFMLSTFLSIYLSNIEFRVHMNVFFLLFLCHLMYIKVLPVLELFKGAVTVVIIALEPSILSRSCPFVVAVV